jgi:hypothetical protein
MTEEGELDRWSTGTAGAAGGANTGRWTIGGGGAAGGAATGRWTTGGGGAAGGAATGRWTTGATGAAGAAAGKPAVITGLLTVGEPCGVITGRAPVGGRTSGGASGAAASG